MAQPTVSTLVGEVATHSRDRISLPSYGIRKLGWAPGDRLLVQRLNEDMVLLMRRPKKSTGQVSDEVYEEPTDAGDAAEALHGGSGVALDSSEAAMTSTQAEEQLTGGQPTVGETASATALLERLEQRIAALEQLLANEPAAAEAAGPAEEQPESTMVDQEVGPQAAAPVEPPGDGMAEDEAASVEGLGAEESMIEDQGENEQPVEEMTPEVPSSEEAVARDAAADEVVAEEPEAAEAQVREAQADGAEAGETGAQEAHSEEVAQPGEEPLLVGAAPEESGKQADSSSAGPDAVGAEVGAVAGATAGVGGGAATGDTAGADAGSATGVGAGLQAGVALRIIGELLRLVVPEEAMGQAMGHLEAGRREGLLALRTLLAAGIQRIDTMQDAGATAKGATDKT